MNEDEMIDRIDLLHNSVYDMVSTIYSNVTGITPNWDMEWIGEISDAVAEIMADFFNIEPEEIYPSLDE